MRFYGNGIVKVAGKSLRFSKPEKRYEKGFLDVDKKTDIDKLLEFGYKHDEIVKPKAPKKKKIEKVIDEDREDK